MVLNRSNELRLWPGFAVVAVQWLVRFGLPTVAPDTSLYAIIAGVVGGALVVIWWLAFSRALWLERLGVLVVAIAGIAATPLILDRSIATAMMGKMFPIVNTPVMSLAWVGAAWATRRLPVPQRPMWISAGILCACGSWALLRTDGIAGEGFPNLAWRWSLDAEQKLLASTAASTPLPTPPAPVRAPEIKQPTTSPVAVPVPIPTPAPKPLPDWPGFRGPRRDGVVRGLRISSDWKASPPAEIWRRKVGPGWSSFASGGGLIYTQEQRGEFEIVSCYRAATGEPVWTHRHKARFWESNAGAGPRSTPTLSEGRVYTLGATGILNAIDAGTGAVVWARDAAGETGAKTPDWGFAGSPLITDGMVVAAVSGHLIAYDVATGTRRWSVEAGRTSYSSPHLLSASPVKQILLVHGSGLTAVAPATGTVLWKYVWSGFAPLQPAIVPDGLLMATSSDAGGIGIRRLAIASGAEGWAVEEKWTSTGLKPYFNDFAVHGEHAYGFDGSILSCIDLSDGKRKWKGGRFGHGQMLILADQGAMLVLSEEGELALVATSNSAFEELARVRVLEGKTWNHPALSGNTLLVRNGEEMAAYRLPLAESR
ncbi:MAG: PQQ-binding-like beta-propeller repeat protein [Bryobacterales bacterium]|nr:PQQ-binding-like beta-propeller repeat protein [Bryobacterales bacterium]